MLQRVGTRHRYAEWGRCLPPAAGIAASAASASLGDSVVIRQSAGSQRKGGRRSAASVEDRPKWEWSSRFEAFGRPWCRALLYSLARFDTVCALAGRLRPGRSRSSRCEPASALQTHLRRNTMQVARAARNVLIPATVLSMLAPTPSALAPGRPSSERTMTSTSN